MISVEHEIIRQNITNESLRNNLVICPFYFYHVLGSDGCDILGRKFGKMVK